MTAVAIVLFGLIAGAFVAQAADVLVPRWKAERAAVRAFRECYKRAWAFCADASGVQRLSEDDVMYVALDMLRERIDIKTGRHRFGTPASDIIKAHRIEDGKILVL